MSLLLLKMSAWLQQAGWPTRHKLWKIMLHRAEICLPFVEALERRCLPGACTSWPQQAGWPTRHRLCPKWKLRCIARKLSYLLLKRWKGDVCHVLVPADHSRRVGPHVTGYVRNENLRCIERKLSYLLLKRWKGDVCLMFVPADHSWRVGPHVTGYVHPERNTEGSSGSIDRRSCRTDYLCVTSLLFSLCRMISKEYKLS